ncbi:MAG: beta strand repeat-containing protein, partial [Candidatus Enterousia sp.]
MMKKLLSFVCCLLPFSAGAVVVNDRTPGAGAAYGGDGTLTTYSVNSDTVEVIKSGNGIVISKDSAGVSGGLTVANNVIIGQNNTGSTGGDLFAEVATDIPFTIQSDGNISIGSMLQVLSGRELGITTKTTGTLVDASVGSIDAVGKLTIQNIRNFTSGNIDSATALGLSAQTITTGAVDVTGGTANIAADGALVMSQFQTAGTQTNISAGSIESGNIQNNTGSMKINVTGDLITKDKTATSNLANIGSIENSGTLMDIKAQNVTVAGTMKNDSDNGDFVLNAGSLSVTGGDETNRSFVNAGNLYMKVDGETNLAHGFDLSNMDTDNEFYLKTGTLKFGSVDAADAGDAWLQVFAKDLKSFYLEITDGNVNANTVINGSAANTAANMTIVGKSVAATSVTNNGNKLQINATDSAGAINFTGAVQGASNSVTNIVSAGNLTVAGTVSNSGTMLINANNVNLAGVANDGTELEISSLTDETGIVNISGTVSNKNGKLIVSSRQIDIDGVITNYSGMTDIKGSDASGGSVTLGGIDVQGGSFALDALVGSASVDGGLSVTGGAFNVGQNTHSLTVGNSVQFNGDVTLSGVNAIGAGNVNIAASGPSGFILTSTATNGAINIDGNITAADNLFARSAQFDAKTINVEKNVTAENQGKLIFGATNKASQTTIDGDVVASNGGAIEFYSDDTDVGSLSGNGLFLVHGSQITANTGEINVTENLWFDGTTSVNNGMVVTDTDTLTLKTVANTADVDVSGGVTIGADNTLALDSARDATIGGLVVADGALSVTATGDANLDNTVKTKKSLDVTAKNITTADITNSGNMNLNATGNIKTGAITNSDDTTINATTVTTAAIESTNGAFDVTGDTLNSTYITISGGTSTLDVETIVATNDISVSGDLVQSAAGATNAGMLNIVRDEASLSGHDLSVTNGGAFRALNNSASYNLTGDVNIAGAFTVENSASVTMMAGGDASTGALTNNGTLNLTVSGTDGLTINGAIENTDNLTLVARNGFVTANSFIVNTGTADLMGKGMNLSGAFGAADKSSMLYHGTGYALSNGDYRIVNSGYELTASNVNLAGIKQNANGLTINTSDLKIANDIDVVDLRVAANPSNDWLMVDVGGNVLGGAQFIGLKEMKIGGNYKFNNNSQISAAILPYATAESTNTTTNNYWSKVSLNDDNTLGKITNASDGAALIQVNGAFTSTASDFNVAVNGGELQRPQIGLTLFDIVDQGTAIWLLHADGGVSDESLDAKIRNLNVSFCNDGGTLCFDYLEAISEYNKSGTDLPAYVSVRDSDGDGTADSLYVVFDPRFGGPVEVFKIQPIVGRVDDHTYGEHVAAGALDNLITGKLYDSGFYNRTPIEAIPLIFKNSNMSTMANELYNRMEYYNLNRDGVGLARFSRLFQVRELEQIAGSISLNEHTNFRSFEDRMFDEFIWNRNRNLKKAWIDVDYGMFYQNATDNKHIDGNRFSISGGFDWQESQTLLLGVTGRVSHMSSDNSDSMDLGYLPGQHIAGHVKTTVADTDIGLGAYLMKILGQKTRVYGNGFLDIHVLDVDREQNFVSKISGNGT